LKTAVKRSLYISLLAAIAAGLYPLLFYVSNNYTLVNSWSHVTYFASVFLLAPLVVFAVATFISRIAVFQKFEKYVLPLLNCFSFLFFVKTVLLSGFRVWLVVGILFFSMFFAILFYRYLLKVIVFQLLLAIVASFYLVPRIVTHARYSNKWMEQPDAITQVQFKNKPNVYLIQPDGYVNFSELTKGYYTLPSNELEDFLRQERFTFYPDFRSNYASTLSSNSSLFTMKHHYYLGTNKFTEMLDARNIIVGNNPVLTVFKNNGYITNFWAQRPYLLTNKPKIAYDNSNYVTKGIGYITTGLEDHKDVIKPLCAFLETQGDMPAFHFIEILEPGHVSVKKIKSEGVQKEREKWIAKLPRINSTLITMVKILKEKDPEGIIIILADHGGFVGLEYMHQAYYKTQDRDKLYSMFGANLAIYWPQGVPGHNDSIKTTVNLFRNLFSYLGEQEILLDNLQEDSSYLPILYGARKGVYKVLDTQGNVVFEKQ
jgi:hypothetical protein